MKRLPINVFSAALALMMGSQASAQTFPRPDFTRLILPNWMLLTPCVDESMVNVELNPLEEGYYQIVVHFKGVSIDTKREMLSCTLYSKLPSELANSGQRYRLVSSSYQLTANLPANAQGVASLGVGQVPRGERSFPHDNQLVAGTAENLERLTASMTQSSTNESKFRFDLTKLLTNAALIKQLNPAVIQPLRTLRKAPVVAATPVKPILARPILKNPGLSSAALLGLNKFTFYNPALISGLVKGLFPGIPLILKTVVVIIDGSGTEGLRSFKNYGLTIPDSEKDAIIEGDQYLANQFQLWFISDDATIGQGQISVDWLEMIVKVEE